MNDPKLFAQILKRCSDMSEGKNPEKYRDFYGDKTSDSQHNYVNRFNVNTNFRSSNPTLTKGNITVTGSSSSSSSQSRTGPNMSGFMKY